jgi:hypothetical protein
MGNDEDHSPTVAQDLLASADDRYERNEWNSVGTESAHVRVYEALRAIANRAEGDDDE